MNGRLQKRRTRMATSPRRIHHPIDIRHTRLGSRKAIPLPHRTDDLVCNGAGAVESLTGMPRSSGLSMHRWLAGSAACPPGVRPVQQVTGTLVTIKGGAGWAHTPGVVATL